MDTANIIALYAAGLSSILAIAQGIKAWRSRTKVSVAAEMVYTTGDSYGTPVQVQRGEDILEQCVSVSFTIRNLGGTPIQILGILLEDLNKSSLQVSQISANNLPVVLEPGTTTEVTLQKEHLDLLECCTFIGVVDGTGRRHPVPTRQAREVIEESWRLPSRLAVFQQRDDPSKRVIAHQLAVSGKFTERPAKRRLGNQPRVIAKRMRPLMETLLERDQARAQE